MKTGLYILFVFGAFTANAQELFPYAEPASTLPKYTFTVKTIETYYNEIGIDRNMLGLRLQYGLTSKLTIGVSEYYSNHHGNILPDNFLSHTHPTNNPKVADFFAYQQYGLIFPYLFAGPDYYAKYRIFAHDGDGTHLRMAVYAEYEGGDKIAHDEAQPSLMGDNNGFGGGYIITQLYKRWAVSLTTGFIIPQNYTEEKFYTDPATPGYHLTTVEYGKDVNYCLSFGYLLWPRTLKSYKQVNVNLYWEFPGATYGSVVVKKDATAEPFTSIALMGGSYLESRPGLQIFLGSKDRLDCSVDFKLINFSYTIFYYPMFWFSYQHYFYF